MSSQTRSTRPWWRCLWQHYSFRVSGNGALISLPRAVLKGGDLQNVWRIHVHIRQEARGVTSARARSVDFWYKVTLHPSAARAAVLLRSLHVTCETVKKTEMALVRSMEHQTDGPITVPSIRPKLWPVPFTLLFEMKTLCAPRLDWSTVAWCTMARDRSNGALTAHQRNSRAYGNCRSSAITGATKV